MLKVSSFNSPLKTRKWGILFSQKRNCIGNTLNITFLPRTTLHYPHLPKMLHSIRHFTSYPQSFRGTNFQSVFVHVFVILLPALTKIVKKVPMFCKFYQDHRWSCRINKGNSYISHMDMFRANLKQRVRWPFWRERGEVLNTYIRLKTAFSKNQW